jgi:ABC-type sugar transport system ATPase subunit
LPRQRQGETVFSEEKRIFVPPEKRGLSMVFQTYATWPHMNVFDNVAYPLQLILLSTTLVAVASHLGARLTKVQRVTR